MEEREVSGISKATMLIEEFHQKFHSIQFTAHPADISGDSPGKGSNVAWAALRLSEAYPYADRENIIITIIDGTFTLTL
jgi:hypothetical protein